jgi:hypothetical protein
MNTRARKAAVIAFGAGLALSCAQSALAQNALSWTWVDHQIPTARWKHAMAFDALHGELVLFGGQTGESNTWVWNGTSWRQAATTGPSPRWEHAMVYDSVRQKVVLAGGATFNSARTDTVALADVWEWNGNAWAVAPSMPDARSGLALAFDTARGRTVMYGGLSSPNVNSTKTYEYDGVAWVEVPGAVGGNSAGDRSGHAMSYDAGRDRTILVGSGSGSGAIDQYEWDGTNRTWASRVFATAPGRRLNPQLAYDASRSRIVLMGGEGFNDTWLFDGTTWTLATNGNAAPGGLGRDQHAMAYDATRSRVLLFGGIADNANPQRDLYSWSGTAWSAVLANRTSPSPRWNPGMDYDDDRARSVVFGGLIVRRDGLTNAYSAGTYEWDGSAWSVRTPAASPGGRHGMPLVYDNIRKRHVLYGGGTTDSTSVLAEVWEFDPTGNGTWTRQADSDAGRRWGQASAFDRSRGNMVVFGGVDQNGAVLGDTWIYNGTSWTQYTAAPSPSARGGARMIYDSTRGKIVIFGGINGSTAPNDTWEWDGSSWQEIVIPAANRPPGRTYAFMAYDTDHQVVVLAAGLPGGTASNRASLSDQWSFDGSTWKKLSGDFRPLARVSGNMTYDAARKQLVVACGSQEWWASRLSTGQTYTASITCYANCDGSTGTPALGAADFVCFLSAFRAGDPYANCDGSTGTPSLTAADFVCFLNAFRAGCP